MKLHLWLGLALATTAWAGMDQNTLEIKLGKTIDRSWPDVQKAGFAYAPKQAYDQPTKETHIWLTPIGLRDSGIK